VTGGGGEILQGLDLAAAAGHPREKNLIFLAEVA
jgi:hypothetical protein